MDLGIEYTNEINKQVINILKNEIITGFKDITDLTYYYFDFQSINIFKQFIIDQMIFNNYEVFKNGQEILVSYNNKNIINEKDIIDYINENHNLKKYLKQLLVKFYYENVEVNEIINAAIKQAIKDKKDFKDANEKYNVTDVEYTVDKVIDNYHYVFEDVLNDDNFTDFIKKEFSQTDIINEIKVNKPNNTLLNESITPESRRRIINAITQGAALRGTFAFYLFKEHLDDLDPSLVDAYGQIMKNTFGIYDDENAIAMMLSMLAQGQKTGGGSSKVIIKEVKSNITIKATAICFPMLVHELIKGLYELISLQGFKGSKEERQAVVDKVDLLKNEPSDLRYGKFIYDALNNIFAKSEYNDPRIREFFFTDVYQLDDDEFISFIENAINEELTSAQQKWAKDTLRDISIDLKADDFDATGLDEIKINIGNKKKLVINSDPDARLYFKNNNWLGKENWDKWAIKDSIPVFRHKNFVYLVPYKRTEEALNVFKNTLTKMGINSQITTNYVTPVIKVTNKYYDVDEPQDLNEIKINKSSTLRIIKKGDDWALLANDKYIFDNYYNWDKRYTVIDAHVDVEIDDNDNEYLEVYIPEPGFGGGAPEEEIEAAYDEYETNLSIAESVLSKYSTESSFDSYKIPLNRIGGSNLIPLIENKPFLESFYKEVKILANDLKTSLINEYSEKTITTTIERWKKNNPKVDNNLAKQLIQRFDQVKSGLAQKLNIIALSDELRKGQNYLNIDKYSFDDMVKLIRSLPENPEKVKKDAIGKFVQQDGIDKPTAQSYVARFIVNKDKLKAATQEGLEDEGFTKEEVLNFIPKKLLSNNAYLDPRAWTWQSFEQMLDALFPSQKTAGEEGENLVSTDANKIYDKDGIEIYKGDDVHKCISYNPVSDQTKRKKYGWCVTQVGNTNYDYYRFGDKAPTFYFVFDRSKDSSPEHSPFKDQWHAFVIQVTADDKEYIVTGADNRGDTPTKDKGWEGVANIVPADTWAKIKGLKDYFKPISLSPAERGRKFASGKNLSLSEFKELSQDEKILYIQGKGSKNEISPEILKILPQYKINLEGRSTTLANVAMDSRQKFPYSVLKDNEALIKRYAVVSSRHFPNDPLPLPFIKYLDEDAKQKYLEKYDDNLTFEYIEKYFGDKVAEKYVETQLKTLNYLPKSAIKYIKNDKLKRLFEIYSKLFDSWEFGSQTNISDEALENTSNMPDQEVSTVPFNQKQWNNLSPAERKTIIELAEKFNKNLQYQTLLWALPFIIKNGNKKYVLLPKSTEDYQYDSWVLVDESGKIIKDNISGDSELENQPLYLGYPSEDDDFNRIYNLKDLKIA